MACMLQQNVNGDNGNGENGNGSVATQANNIAPSEIGEPDDDQDQLDDEVILTEDNGSGEDELDQEGDSGSDPSDAD